MSSGTPPIGPHDLEQRLRQLEAIHRTLGEQIAALRLMQQEYGLGTFQGTYQPPEPYDQPTVRRRANQGRGVASPRPPKRSAR